MGTSSDEFSARIAAMHAAYAGVWADFLRNRMAQAGERAAALLRILDTIPDDRKDAELWVTEADYLYIAGAARGNAAEALQSAVARYERALSLPEGWGNANARRMRAEALLRLRRYEEAWAAFGELAALQAGGAFPELEAAPFRMRHDAALCERLAAVGRFPLETARAAAEALRGVAARVEVSPLPGGRQRWPRVAQLRKEDQEQLRKGHFGGLLQRSAPYPLSRLAVWRPPLAGGAWPDPLGKTVNWQRAEEEYRTEKLTIVDDFFAPAALEELWTYSREAPIFATVRNGFLGAFPADGNTHPLILAAALSLERHMPNVLRGHPLGLWWLFKYTEAGPSGIGIHADAAAVNVNIWLTPDDARRSGGGLDIYTELPPVEAGIAEINAEFATAEEEAKFRDTLLQAGSVHRVEYRRNRAAIFISDLYHASQPFDFADCTEAPRVNLTLLFGDRARAAEAAAAGATKPEPAAGKRGRGDEEEASGWELFD